MPINEPHCRSSVPSGYLDRIRLAMATYTSPAAMTVALVISYAVSRPTCFAQQGSLQPGSGFANPQQPNSTAQRDHETHQGGAGEHHHHHHDPSESVTNNYIGYGWPTPFLFGGNVRNFYNGVPLDYGPAYGGYPYGSTWYHSQFNNGFGVQPFGVPIQPGFGQPGFGQIGFGQQGLLQPGFGQRGFGQPGFIRPGPIAPGGVGILQPGVAPAAIQPAMPAVAIPKAIDLPPANDATAEIQRRVDVLKPSTPAGRERADRFLSQGDDQFAAQRYAGAIARYRDAMAKAPDYPKPHFRLAHSYIASAKFELALTRFLMALELAGSGDRVNFSLEELYRGDKLAKQTHLERLQDAILREPGDGGLVFLMALTLHYDQHPLEARQLFIKSKSMSGVHQSYVHHFLPVVPIAEPE